ncbi:MAG: reverse transcriptase domain-containing protein, partial [Bacteroidota bacterium]
ETDENHETVGETDENHETVGETDENHETDENGYDTAIHNDHDTITQSNPDLGTNENNDIEARTYDEEAAIPTTEIAEIPFETPSEVSHNETPPEVSHNETIRNEGAPNQGARNEGAEERRVRPERTDVSNTVPQRYNLRQRREPDTSYRFAHSIDNPHSTQSYEKAHSFLQTTCETVQTESDLFKAIFCFTMHTLPEIETESVGEEVAHVLAHVLTNQHSFTQMSAEAGIKKHGRIAEDALLKEFKQLFDRDVFTILDGKTLSAEDKAAALRAVNLIKEKRDGVLKGRTCADGRPQRKLYTKAETTSPTVSSEALAITTIVDAYEGRDIATCDITGAYLNAHIDDYVTMKFTGRAVDVLCQLDPSFKEKIVYEKGRKILYARLNRALYGCVKSALLWYELFSKTLVGLGFKLNPYDPCVANAVIDGKQITVIWYVDDLKISHVNPNVVSNIIEQIEARFGKMNVTRGKVHVFLGMTITFNDDRTATIDMENYLVEAIAESNLDIQGKAATPATKNLFEIDPESPTLPEKPAETFHSIVAKLLYVAVRARMDILLAVGFLCTRVKAPTVQDQRKLRRLLQYLNGTLDLHLRLGADDLHTLLTWVDAAYAVHDDFRSHTGGGMSFGIGAFACKSSKQKLNTKSSTEAEVVGVSDYLPYTLWTQMFLEEQGFELLRNVVYQDNESAMRLEQNGRASAGQKSRHIHIRHFFVTDRVKAGDVQIVHCPTLSMLADFLTKPVQGSLFRKFRDVLLGHAHVRTLLDPESSAPEERVGKRAIPDSGS